VRVVECVCVVVCVCVWGGGGLCAFFHVSLVMEGVAQDSK